MPSVSHVAFYWHKPRFPVKSGPTGYIRPGASRKSRETVTQHAIGTASHCRRLLRSPSGRMRMPQPSPRCAELMTSAPPDRALPDRLRHHQNDPADAQFQCYPRRNKNNILQMLNTYQKALSRDHRGRGQTSNAAIDHQALRRHRQSRARLRWKLAWRAILEPGRPTRQRPALNPSRASWAHALNAPISRPKDIGNILQFL